MSRPHPAPESPADNPGATPPGATVGAGVGRAGRNLPVAIVVGLVLAGLILAALFIVKTAFVGVLVVAVLVAIWELSKALGTGPTRVPLVPVGVGGVAMVVGAYLGGAAALSLAFGLTVVGSLVWRLGAGAAGYVRDASAGVLVAAYVPLLAAFVALLLAADDGAWRVTTYVLVTTASDIGGYAVGAWLGRHPMAPVISPKKSWEGFAGSVATCCVVGWLAVAYGLGGRWWVGVGLGVAAAAVATLGDLVESLVKRDLGLKDMGSLLPGHGGLMDRLDSLLFVAPVSWVILQVLVPVS